MSMCSITCDICGAESVFIHKGTRDNPDIDVYECTNCHTKQLNKIVDNDYQSGYMNGKRMTSEEIQARLESCKTDDMRRANMVEPWIRGKRVLDFGCGFGGFIKYASGIAGSVSGIELGSDEIEYMLGQGYDVSDSIDTFDDPFDVITLFHVFEHLKDPAKWLDIISEKIKKDGILFIEVPNANDALLSLYDNAKFADFTYWSAHLYLYTRESLRKVICDNGSLAIEDEGQVQRYPLANHLYWLSKGEPGGQNKWHFLDSPALDREYKKLLEEKDMCDTLFFRIRKK